MPQNFLNEKKSVGFISGDRNGGLRMSRSYGCCFATGVGRLTARCHPQNQKGTACVRKIAKFQGYVVRKLVQEWNRHKARIFGSTSCENSHKKNLRKKKVLEEMKQAKMSLIPRLFFLTGVSRQEVLERVGEELRLCLFDNGKNK